MAKTKNATQLNRDSKAAIQLAFEGLGGVERLQAWANQPQNLGTFYTQIWTKIIPKEVKGEHTGKDGQPMRMVIEWQKPGEGPTE